MGEKDPRSELNRRRKLPLSCARSVLSRAAAAAAVAVAGGGGGRRRRRRRGEPSLARAAAWARGREPNSARRSPARGLRAARQPAQRGLVPAPKLSLGKAKRETSDKNAGSTRPARGTRVRAALLGGAQGPAHRRPPASEGRCPGRGRRHRPASLPRLDPKG